MCHACNDRDLELHARALLIFSFKTCQKVAVAKETPAMTPRLLEELTADRLQKKLGRILSLSRFVAETVPLHACMEV